MSSSRSWLRRFKSPAAQGILFAVLWLAVTNVTIYFIYLRAVEAVKEEIREGLLRNVSAAATIVDGDQHKKFKSKASKSDPAYLYLLKRLETLRIASRDVRYLYTNVIDSGKVYFVVNGSPQNDNDKDGRPDEAPQLMDSYPDAGKALLQALTQHKPTVDREPYTDSWGTFYSAYAPFFDAKGRFVGTLGMDLELVTLQARLVPIGVAAQRAAFTSGVLAVLFGTSVWYFRRTNKSLLQRRLEAESELGLIVSGRSQDRRAAALQLAAVAARFAAPPPGVSDDSGSAAIVSRYGQALQHYAQARLRQAPVELANFELASVLEAAFQDNSPHQLKLQINRNVPKLLCGSENHLREILSTLTTHPFARANLGSLDQVEVDIADESLNALELVITLGYQAADESRALKITHPIVNEGSTYAVFTITGCQNQALSLTLGNTVEITDNDATISGFTLEFSTDGGDHWSVYTWNGATGERPVVPAGGSLLVRVDISSEQDDQFEGIETFELTVISEDGSTAVALATIQDDGNGSIYHSDGTANNDALKKDDRDSSIKRTGLAQILEEPDLVGHVSDEQQLTFAASCEQIRAIAGSIQFDHVDNFRNQLIVILPFNKYIES
jgi:hypothetical protein